MPLSTAHFLATVVTARTTSLGSRDRLGIDDGGAGSRIWARQATQPFAQDGMYLLPGAVHAPSPEVVVGGLPRQGEVVREQAPSTPAPEHVEDGVQYLARFVSSGTSARFGSGNERLEDLPFVIAEVGRVGASGGHGKATPSRFGSRILLLRVPSQTPSNAKEQSGDACSVLGVKLPIL